MSKIFIKNRYGITPTELLNDASITLKAKGLFAYIQSKPDGWKFSAERISKQSSDGIDSIKSGLKELESLGFLKRIRIIDDDGKFSGYDYELNSTIGGFSTDGKTVNGKTVDGKPTDISNIDNSKIDVVKKNKDVVAPQSVTTPPAPKNIDYPMTLPEFVEWCHKSTSRHIHIIGDWADTINHQECKTKKQWESFIKRNLRPARELAPFTDEQLIAGFTKIKKGMKDGWLKRYTLETLTKFILN